MAHIELQNVSKHFGGVRALEDVSLAIELGTVHAIVGENGAGKSTLGRIVAGVHSADGGRMLLDGAPTSFRSPREALDRGVAAIAQEPSLVPQLTVAENVCLGAEPRSVGFIRRRSCARHTRSSPPARDSNFPARPRRHAEHGGATEDGDPAGTLARRADHRHGRAVGGAQRARDGATARDRPLARRSGTTIVLISHFLREVLELADSVTVLRDGS